MKTNKGVGTIELIVYVCLALLVLLIIIPIGIDLYKTSKFFTAVSDYEDLPAEQKEKYLNIKETDPAVEIGYGWKCSDKLLKKDKNGEYWLTIYFDKPVDTDIEGKYEIWRDNTVWIKAKACPGNYKEWIKYNELMNEESGGCEECFGCTQEELNNYLLDKINNYLETELPQDIEKLTRCGDIENKVAECALKHKKELYEDKTYSEFLGELNNFDIEEDEISDECKDYISPQLILGLEGVKHSVYYCVSNSLFSESAEENCEYNLWMNIGPDDIYYATSFPGRMGLPSQPAATACKNIYIRTSSSGVAAEICLSLVTYRELDWPKLTYNILADRKSIQFGPFPRGANGFYYLIRFIYDGKDVKNSFCSGNCKYPINPDRNVVKFEVP